MQSGVFFLIRPLCGQSQLFFLRIKGPIKWKRTRIIMSNLVLIGVLCFDVFAVFYKKWTFVFIIVDFSTARRAGFDGFHFVSIWFPYHFQCGPNRLEELSLPYYRAARFLLVFCSFWKQKRAALEFPRFFLCSHVIFSWFGRSAANHNFFFTNKGSYKMKKDKNNNVLFGSVGGLLFSCFCSIL